MRISPQIFVVFTLALYVPLSFAQTVTKSGVLRGSNGPGRSWWDAQKYDLKIAVDDQLKRISGESKITFISLSSGTHPLMQIDLQQPMQIDSVVDEEGHSIKFTREGDVYWLDFGNKEFYGAFSEGSRDYAVRIQFSGVPHQAKRPPWDGGWVWTTDAKGRPWVSAADQGIGGSLWFPCKDDDEDEPDRGATITITPPDSLVAVSNGRGKKAGGRYIWEVKNPINLYDIIPYIGNYVSWDDTFYGEGGPLDVTYAVLDYNLARAKEQFAQAPMVLRAFEYWFGPYPFYEDSFKLVEAPYLGMEHQSAVAYGNQFTNGYSGKGWPIDLSKTGVGMQWDFIIVHEVAHEWFGNSISAKDIADTWIHEGFATYAETLFTEYHFGKEAGDDYVIGLRKRIKNDAPIIGIYGIHGEGSVDSYAKGANMLHTIRQIINDDEKFRQILRGMNEDFHNQTVSSQLIENYISDKAGIDFTPVFNQYLRTTQIPALEYKIDGTTLSFRWTNVVDGFNMRVELKDGTWLAPTSSWQSMQLTRNIDAISIDRNFYVDGLHRR